MEPQIYGYVRVSARNTQTLKKFFEKSSSKMPSVKLSYDDRLSALLL